MAAQRLNLFWPEGLTVKFDAILFRLSGYFRYGSVLYIFFNNSAPSYMSEMLLPVGQSRITRRSKNKLNQPFRESNNGQHGLSYLGPKIWNNLHSDLKSAESITNFKDKIKANFFKELQKREDNPYEYYSILKFANKTSFDHYSLHRCRIYIFTLFFLIFILELILLFFLLK